MDSRTAAHALTQIAAYLELRGEAHFRSRAYEQAAGALVALDADDLADGALDYDDELLDRFDFVVGSIHSRFAMDQPAMTARVLRALDDPRLTILGHPTGRLLLTREAYAIEIGPDEHSPAGLDNVAYGVGIARKGGLTAREVLNARSVDDVLAFARARRSGGR